VCEEQGKPGSTKGLLRPEQDGGEATFYMPVTRNAQNQDFAASRQLFLVEQGYRYSIQQWCV
jgi:DNA excision repair protein ERCC-3